MLLVVDVVVAVVAVVAVDAVVALVVVAAAVEHHAKIASWCRKLFEECTYRDSEKALSQNTVDLQQNE